MKTASYLSTLWLLVITIMKVYNEKEQVWQKKILFKGQKNMVILKAYLPLKNTFSLLRGNIGAVGNVE